MAGERASDYTVYGSIIRVQRKLLPLGCQFELRLLHPSWISSAAGRHVAQQGEWFDPQIPESARIGMRPYLAAGFLLAQEEEKTWTRTFEGVGCHLEELTVRALSGKAAAFLQVHVSFFTDDPGRKLYIWEALTGWEEGKTERNEAPAALAQVELERLSLRSPRSIGWSPSASRCRI
jgi:hypothetical protein